MATSATTDIDWGAAVERVVWVPVEHRVADMSVDAALRMLRCSERSFARLLALGLPSVDGDDGLRFDAFDLKNVALCSGSNATAVELSMRYVLAFMADGVRDLTRPIRSRYVLRTGGEQHDAVHGVVRRVYRPTPEAFGGTLHSWTSRTGPLVRVDGPYFVVGGGCDVMGGMTTVGREEAIRSTVIRSAMWDLLDSGVRWHYLPASMLVQPHKTLASGAASCSVLCRVLEDRLRDAGADAAAYHGWINAAAPVDHGWVEVVDEDGRTKCLDPSLALLASRNGFGTRAFAALATGSFVNRIVPTRAPVHVPFTADAGAVDVVTLACTPDNQPAAGRGTRWRRTR